MPFSKAFRMQLSLSLACTLFGIPILGESVVCSAVEKIAGYIGAVDGSVMIDQGTAKVGSELRVGQLVRTGYSSRTTLILGKQNVIHLGENSSLKIQDQTSGATTESTELDLIQGRIRAIVKQKSGLKKTFSVRARTVVMGVRGTHIMMENPENPASTVKLHTLEGQAEVKVPGLRSPVVLNKNEGFSTLGPPAQSPPIPSASAAGHFEKFEPEQLQKLAAQVAAPPLDVVSTSDIKVLQTPPRIDSSVSTSSFATLPLAAPPAATGQTPVIPIDPAANGGGVRNQFQVTVRLRASQ
jgi:hypothetical protein